MEKKEKRELFIWNSEYDVKLAKEVLVEVPYKHKPLSKDRGTSWTKIAQNLQGQKGMSKVTQRSARERFEKLYKEFKERENAEKKASGVEVEFDELHVAITDIHELIVEYEEKRQKKDTSDQAQAEEMRKRATESLSVTKKRQSPHKDDDNHDADSDSVTPKKRKGRGSLIDMLELSIEKKATGSAGERELKQKELDLRAEELHQQQQFQSVLIQQQQQQFQHLQQFQQQQQAMNMAILNTLTQVLKPNN